MSSPRNRRAVRLPATDFGIRVLPFGVFRPPGGSARVGVAVGTDVLDLAAALGDRTFAADTLNPFLAQGPERWRQVHEQVAALVTDGLGAERADLYRQQDVELLLPVEVADFVDFFSSVEHAVNAGKILRPGEEPLKPNYRHLPVGYHGRSGTVVVSGTPVVRPWGQVRIDGDPPRSVEQPSERLDIEVELGYVVGTGSELGTPVTASEFARHVFGVVILIDWSARDIQAWEYQPLGPFLGKSFATTISPWVVPLTALTDAWVPGPVQDPAVLPYLQVPEPRNLSVELVLEVNGTQLSRPQADALYWSPAQQLAHMTRNGACLRVGDLYGTGTVSSFDPAAQGSLLELSHSGRVPVPLDDGSALGYLRDDDEVVIRAWAGPGRLPLGDARGRVGKATG
ncbi:fumarylacetoacetate hydrolase family protein [Streptomyces sp. NPDC048282]|uniref:fumarylacetoacetate hydrolase family protein n=1 Tax=unclassified Streptomyces TaxID=2593676 RepID=UPI003718F35B